MEAPGTNAVEVTRHRSYTRSRHADITRSQVGRAAARALLFIEMESRLIHQEIWLMMNTIQNVLTFCQPLEKENFQNHIAVLWGSGTTIISPISSRVQDCAPGTIWSPENMGKKMWDNIDKRIHASSLVFLAGDTCNHLQKWQTIKRWLKHFQWQDNSM